MKSEGECIGEGFGKGEDGEGGLSSKRREARGRACRGEELEFKSRDGRKGWDEGGLLLEQKGDQNSRTFEGLNKQAEGRERQSCSV